MRFKIKSTFERYGDYVRLNRNLIVSIATSMIISSLFSQALKEQTEYLNATLTIMVSYATYYLVFGSLYYRDNKQKYVTEEGIVNKKRLRKDFLKLVSSVGVAEIIFLLSRWFSHFHFLSVGQEPYLASLMSHVIAATLYALAVNVGVHITKLYKNDSKKD